MRKLLPLLLTVAAAGMTAMTFARASSQWVAQGPAPIFNGQVEGMPGNPVAGAVNAIVTDPANPASLLVGTVNGGIWATANATAGRPNWVPLTDRQPALSIASLARSPADPRLLFAGSGSTSSLSDEGSPGYGILRSINRGATWQVVAGSTFAGQVVDAVVPTRLRAGAVVLAATRRFPATQDIDRNGAAAAPGPVTDPPPARGIFRSVNATAADPGSVTFVHISGTPGSGLPEGGVSSLIGDPSAVGRFYAGVSATDGAGPRAGVYRSLDGGRTWRLINGSGAKALTGLAASGRILLTIHTDRSNNVLYAAVIGSNGSLTGVFRSTDLGGNWTALGVPSPPIFASRQGGSHGALAADPVDPGVVFVAGDTQGEPLPNEAGCTDFVGNVFRGDAALPPLRRWQNVVCDGANGTAPHADSRSMIFDANGDLLQANDGGVYRLANPNRPGLRRWLSLIGDIAPTEFHSVAYDPLSRVVLGGSQDNGNAYQTRRGSLAWQELTVGDGGVVAIDADQARHPGTTLRYTVAYDLLGFMRTTWNAANSPIGRGLPVRLRVVSGRCAGRSLIGCDKTIQFYSPYVLNTVDPRRMLIGTAALYESLNGGDALQPLSGDYTGALISGLAYGGRRAGRDYPGVIYAGDGVVILHRVNRGGTIVPLKFPGAGVRALAISAFDYRLIAVVDGRNRVWLSADEGRSWADLTGNLASLTSQVRSIYFYSPAASLARSVLIAGGFGVFQLPDPGSGTRWSRLGGGLPNALFLDLHYYPAEDLLLAGALGRGAWMLNGAFRGGAAVVAAGTPAPATPPAPNPFGASPALPFSAPLPAPPGP